MDALRSFWITLWHVDVHKDHHEDRADIINGFLPDRGVYPTRLWNAWVNPKDPEVVVAKEETQGSRAPIAGKTNTFDTLFNYMFPGLGKQLPIYSADGKPFEDWSCAAIQAATPAHPAFAPTGSIDVAMNPQISDDAYSLKIFQYRNPDKSFGVNMDSFREFIGGHPLLLTVDTSVDLETLIGNYGGIAYGYTREIENDPAAKMNYLSSKDPTYQSNYYTERVVSEGGLNPSGVVYPSYTDGNDEMSFFYCKYPVILSCTGERDANKGTLNTSMSYIKDGNTINIPVGANKANGFEKAKDLIKSVFGITQSAEKKELVYISKHHGDIAQTMVKYRKIMLTNKSTNAVIQSSNCKNVFVSIDMNACMKAFTLRNDFVWMYSADKTRLFVWKNTRLNDPKTVFETTKTSALSKINALIKDVEIYNTNVERINVQGNAFYQHIKTNFLYKPKGGTLVDAYKNYIKDGIQLAILSKYVPKEPLTPISELAVNYMREQSSHIGSLMYNEDGSSMKIINDIMVEIGNIKQLIHLPAEFTTLTVMKADGTPQPVSIEKDVLFQKTPSKITGRRLGNIWDSIDLLYNPGDKGVESLLCRNGTRFNSSWGLDIILNIYNRLKEYNPDYADKFVGSLNEVVSTDFTKQVSFHIGLNIIGLGSIISAAPSAGGSRYSTRRIKRGGGQTRTTTRVSNTHPPTTLRLKLQSTNTNDELLEVAIDDMLSDMMNHVYLYSMIRYETSYKAVLEQFNTCMNATYGIQLPAAIRRTAAGYPDKQIGGDGEIDFIKEMASYMSGLEPVRSGRIATEDTVFNDSDIFASTYSEFEQYTEIIKNFLINKDNIGSRLLRVTKGRSKSVVDKRIETIEFIKDMLDTLNNDDIDDEEWAIYASRYLPIEDRRAVVDANKKAILTAREARYAERLARTRAMEGGARCKTRKHRK